MTGVAADRGDGDSGAAGCQLLHGFFERAARRWPEAVAVDVPPGAGRPLRQQITYEALANGAKRIAQALHPHVGGEAVVAIFLPRDSALLYAAQLAVLKTGAAWTCIDPSFPDERVRDVLTDSEAAAVLTDEAGSGRLGPLLPESCRLLNAESYFVRETPPAALPGFPAPAWLTPSSLAYIIYTSGTTGKPKGVMIEHGSVVNLVEGDLAEFGLGPGDRIAQGSSAAYDSSVEEIWLAFAGGATLVVMDDETARLGPDLIDWLRSERITVFCPPPTLLRATGCDDPASALPDLKLLYVGGEALTRDVADRWARGRRLVNGYGPTEVTVTSVRGDVVEGGPITIGQPLSGLTALVLDAGLNEVSGEEPGELCLGGAGLARGYWKRPELTAEKFMLHPTLGRFYRTGDLVRRDPLGHYHYLGRIDSQVKIRGYRIELEGIETLLTECPGVRAAACRVQDAGGNARLVAYVVPEDPAAPPPPEALRAWLEPLLPGYSIPSGFGVLAGLPSTVGGKLDRAALPPLEVAESGSVRNVVPPVDAMETMLLGAVSQVLGLNRPVSVEADFFLDLGGDSLRAAQLVTALRGRPETAWVTVRDIYESRTVRQLARLAPSLPPPAMSENTATRHDTGHPGLVTAGQTLWLVTVFAAASWAVYFTAFGLLPMMTHSWGLTGTILLAPLWGVGLFMLYTLLAVAFAVSMKRLLIGTYQPQRVPVWGLFHLKNWIVQQSARLIPWRAVEGTEFTSMILRALGARLGRRVDIHRGVSLVEGGWDLLEIGDDVTIGRDAEIRLVEFDAGEIVVGPVRLETGATLEVRAGVAGHTLVEAGGFLAALSSLPRGGRIPAGERWEGIPARPGGPSPEPVPLPVGASPTSWLRQAGLLLLLRAGLWEFLLLPWLGLAVLAGVVTGTDAETLTHLLLDPEAGGIPWLAGLTISAVAVPLSLLLAAGLMRLLGTVHGGAISRWGMPYVRVFLKTHLLEWAGAWLSGTLFWPVWLRMAGMKIGRGCEISTIMDVVPELLTIGPETFFADGIYPGGPSAHRGVVSLSHTGLGRNTFLGNHVVIPAGQQLPDDILLGVCTVADDRLMRPGTSWFGMPPFELPRREVVEMDRSETHEPTPIRYLNRLFWEALRFALPVVPVTLTVAWLRALDRFPAAAVPLVNLAAAALPCLLVLAMKWVLLGRVRPGRHALWSCWCSRWDFLYVAWGQYAAPALSRLEGTLLLPWYLRAMGMTIGRRVVLGGGFAQVVDPDMIHLGDGATVNAMFQAHTFEDRVLKIAHVHVRAGATVGHGTVPLYGADIGEGAQVAPHSVIMKEERLLPGLRYEGAPSRPAPLPPEAR